MKFTFNVDYHTTWGETVYLTGSLPVMGQSDPSHGIKMSLRGEQTWQLELELPDDTAEFEYGYVIVNDNGSIKQEWGHQRKFHKGRAAKVYNIFDRWQDMPADKPYYSSAITECLNQRTDREKRVGLRAGFINIKVDAPMVARDEVVAVCGGCDGLGNWNPAKAVIMSDADYPTWSANVDAAHLPAGTEYKFIILKEATGEVVAWEGGDNRRFNIEAPLKQVATLVTGFRFNNPRTPWRGAGVAIPVFSIRSDEDFGVGDFYDIKKMVDWAALTGQNFIQILPINDTTMTHTWTDSYPYNANSTFALHPMYLRLEEMGVLSDKSRMAHYDSLRKELNSLATVDYEKVNNAKREYTKEIFAENGKATIATDDFRKFLETNRYWLEPYAAFCVLRDNLGTAEISQWGEYATYDEAKVKNYMAEHSDDINFVFYQQYHLDKQMRHVRDYAHSKGVAIKGDIPIGISRTSVDAWISPRLFNLGCQAGAPPDDFSVLGQNWGFPTYNWEEMNRDGFQWWKSRFKKMSEYFDAYRIDHVLGFFRIWQIPMDALHGLLGVFNPALPFTADELRNSYDFWINVDLHTKPYIMDWFLGDYFGEFTDEVRERFLNPIGGGRYALKPEFDTQRKIADYFGTQEINDKNSRICDALVGLVDNVLFIEDPVEKGKYHPRISAQFTYTYRSLNDYEKWCFDRLYNDFFYRRHNDFWYGKAMWKLPPLIDATDMLTCAEDLGMIPDCVPAVMNQLEILSLEIQRMPKDPKAEFGNTWSYPYFSVCTTSTHDMGGIRQWWEENREKTQHFYNNVLHEHGDAPYFAEPWICERIVDLHLKSPSMLCIIPLQDYLSINGNYRRVNPLEEQINVPANSRHYWRYRMHLTVDKLMSISDFNDQLLKMVKESGR
ncbi:MAG: 4-alpha-glucanotransferase [Muribaculaceae bacterium]|nr:4-alpha-glucanotransferase [Muribaculaceae bacterium]